MQDQQNQSARQKVEERKSVAPPQQQKGHVVPSPSKANLEAVKQAREQAHKHLDQHSTPAPKPEVKAKADLEAAHKAIDQADPVLPYQNPPPGVPRVEVQPEE